MSSHTTPTRTRPAVARRSRGLLAPPFVDLAETLRALRHSTDTFGPLIRTQAERWPDRVAFRFEDVQVTYGEFADAVHRLAAALRRAGVGPGEPVAVLARNGPLFCTALGAVAQLGAIGALVNTHLGGDGLVHVLRTTGARIGVCDAEAGTALAAVAGRHTVRFLAETAPGLPVPGDAVPLAELLPERPPTPDLPAVRGEDLFLYIYTSGTTGLPKPALVRHLKFTMGGIGLAALLGIGEGETVYAPLPLYHGESLFVGLAPAFHAGGAFASRRQFSASAFLDDVRRHGAVAFVYVGELCRYVLRQPPTPHDRDHGLRVAAGAGLRADVWAAFQERFGVPRIIEMYGATEGNVALQNIGGPVGSVGRPFGMPEDHVLIARVDPISGALLRDGHGRAVPCAPGEAGELLGRVGAGGSMDYDGYVDRRATEAKLARDVLEPGDVWFRSGDLLRRDAEGWYWFVDRLGDTFRWKGENVSAQEVADILCRAAGVDEACVFGVTVPGEDGRAGMAALVLESGASFDPAGLYAHAERHLPRYAMPAFIRLVSAIDVTGTLKQRKHRLREEGWSAERVDDPLFVRDDAQRTYLPLDTGRRAAVSEGRWRL